MSGPFEEESMAANTICSASPWKPCGQDTTGTLRQDTRAADHYPQKCLRSSTRIRFMTRSTKDSFGAGAALSHPSLPGNSQMTAAKTAEHLLHIKLCGPCSPSGKGVVRTLILAPSCSRSASRAPMLASIARRAATNAPFWFGDNCIRACTQCTAEIISQTLSSVPWPEDIFDPKSTIGKFLM